MSRHALTKSKSPKSFFAIVSSIALTFGALISAQANTTVNVNNAPLNFDTAVYEVQSAVLSNNVITFTTQNPHRLIVGTQIVTSGFTPSTFNRAAAIQSVPSETSFTINFNGSNATATGMGLVTVSDKVYSISNAVGDGTNVVYTSSNHKFFVGQVVDISGIAASMSSGDYNLNLVTITAVTSNTFTVSDASQGTYTSGGTAALMDTDIAVNMVVNDFVDYQAVFVSGGTTVNARVTLMEQRDLEGRSGTPGQVEQLDEPRSNKTQHPYLNTDLDFETGLGDSYAQFQIQFYTGTPSNRTPVTLQNFSASVYDIDGLQYVELSGYTRYFRATNTELEVSATARGTTRFAETDNDGFSGNDSFTKGRVTAEFDSVSLFTYRIGKTAVLADTGSAFYQVDFSPGWDVGGVWSGVRAAAVQAPVFSATPVTYTGPLPVSLSVNCVPAGTASSAVLSGERLNTITSAEVAGKSIGLSEVTATSVKLAIPALDSGTYSVIYTSSSGRLTHLDSLKVCATTSAVNPGTGGAFEAQRLFANYRGDRGPVIARDRAAITAFINQYKGITTVRCVGSTSGVPAKSTDPALAQARAKNACDIVKRLVPNATISLETSTGKGIGQRFRSVTIFISGTN